MTYKISVIFGKDEISKFYRGEYFSELEKEINIKEFLFNTIEEQEAFCKGIQEGVGWCEIYIDN